MSGPMSSLGVFAFGLERKYAWLLAVGPLDQLEQMGNGYWCGHHQAGSGEAELLTVKKWNQQRCTEWLSFSIKVFCFI